MATIPAAVPEAQASISPVGRLIGVLFSPKATFEDIVRKPTWALPLIIMVILGGLAGIFINMKMDWREYIAQQIEKSPRAANMSPEQKQQQIEGGAKFAPISTYIIAPLAPGLMLLVVALVMWGAYNLLGGANTDYKTSLAIVAHSYVPTYLSSLLFFLIVFLKPPGSLNVDNPIATNLAAFLPEDTPKWLDALGKNLDVFLLWALVLIGIGFAFTNPRKLKGGKSFTIVFGVFAAYVVLRVGLAFIMS